jgi:hypothetical protein
VPRKHAADAGDAAGCTTPDGEPLQREGRTRTASQQVLITSSHSISILVITNWIALSTASRIRVRVTCGLM